MYKYITQHILWETLALGLFEELLVNFYKNNERHQIHK
jgi:hypothetical protein